jgi:hypothetical protein
MDREFLRKRRVTIGEWITEGNPSGVWIDLGPRTNPVKHPFIPGTSYDSVRDAKMFTACDGSEVLGLLRPHPLVD